MNVRLQSYFKPVSIILFLITVVTGGVLLYSGKDYWNKTKTITQDAEKKIFEQSEKKVTTINDKLKKIEADCKSLATTLASDKLDEDTIKKTLVEFAQKNSEKFTQIGVAYQLYKFNSATRLYAPTLVKKDSRFEWLNAASIYDYTIARWYSRAVNQNIQWHNPFIDPVTNTSVIRYSVPLYKIENTTKVLLGVFFVDVNRAYLETLDEYELQGYHFIVSADDDHFITHPIKDYINKNLDIFEVSQTSGQQYLRLIGNDIKKKKSELRTYYDSSSRRYYWVIHQQIPLTKWQFVSIVEKTDIFNKNLHDEFIILIYLTILFLTLCSVFVFGAIHDDFRLWLVVGFFSALLTAAMLFIFYLNLKYYQMQLHEKAIIIKNQSELESFLFNQERINERLQKPQQIYVSTGILVKSVLVKPQSQLLVSGFVWQTYRDGIEPKLQIRNALELKLTEFYRLKTDNEVKIGWYFVATVYQRFMYSKYPFDRQTAIIELEYPDYEKNIVLIPDFTSFEEAEISKFIGLQKNILITDWSPGQSYFFYDPTDYKANFGIPNAVHQKDFPNFNFGFDIMRFFYSSFIALFLPIIIVSVILFSILILISVTERGRSLIANIIALVGAIFFAIAIAHQSLKNTLPGVGEIIYFEYYYFAMYGYILFVTINSIYYLATTKTTGLVIYKNNLIPRLIFWPSLLIIFNIIALLMTN